MTTCQAQSTRVRQLFSTLAAVTASNPVLLEGEKWQEKDAITGLFTGRTKTGKDGVVTGTAPNQTITGTAFNSLPFDPSNSIVVDTASVVRKFVRNNSGVSIPKGSAVYQTSSSGTTLTVALADASAEATAGQTLGLAQETIAHNSDGYVIAVGPLDGINTSTLTEGQIVWLSETAGGLTTTRPTQPAHGVVCGYCVKQGPGASGILYVKVDNGLELYELHDVLISAATTGQLLRKASDGLWRNHTPVAADISDSTTAGRALITAADAGAQRTALGSAATPVDWVVGNVVCPINTTLGAGSLSSGSVIYFMPFKAPRSYRTSEFGVRITAPIAGSSFAVALYGSSNGLPTGLPIVTTGSLSAAVATIVSDTAVADLYEDELYWKASIVSSSGVGFQSLVAGSSYCLSVLGVATFAATSTSPPPWGGTGSLIILLDRRGQI